MAARSPRPSLRRPSVRLPARRVVVLAALSIATFACSPQASDSPATAEAPVGVASAQEPGDSTPLEGFTVEGEVGDESTSDHGVRSWVAVDGELDGDLVAAPEDRVTDVRSPSPAPSTRPAAPAPRPTSRPSTTPAAPSTALPTPTSTAPISTAPTTTAPTATSPPEPDTETSTPPAPDTAAILASASTAIASALEDGLITAGTAVALSAKVDTALANLAADGPVTSACGAIGALLGLLSAQDGKEVPTALADQLIALALAASAALAC